MADSIDLPTFDQNLELDEAGDREFSSAIVFGYFDHAENTFNNMDVALEEKDLVKLSLLGQTLKKAAATLGLTKIRDAGEKIHPLGAGIDEPGITGGPDEDGPYEKIQTTLESAKEDYLEVEILLRGYCSKELDS